MRDYLTRNSTTIKAVAVFGVVLIVSLWLLNNNWMLMHVLGPFTFFVAQVSALTFQVLGQDARAVGQSVTVNGTSLSIAQGCNGVEAMTLYFAAIFALPTRWRRRAIGLAIGIVGIFLVNQIRVAGLFLVAMRWPDFLPLAHNYAGQTFVIVMGMALWIFWAENCAEFSVHKARAAAS